MYATMTVDQWFARVKELEVRKADFIAPTSHLSVATALDEGGLPRTTLFTGLGDGGVGRSLVTPNAHRQIAQDLGRPDYDKGVSPTLYEQFRRFDPSLYDTIVNTLLQRQGDARHSGVTGKPRERFVRTLDAQGGEPAVCRAYLSDSYETYDTYPLMDEAIGAVLAELGDIETVSCDINYDRAYLKVVSNRFEGEVDKGDIVKFGVQIKNSETGLGRLEIKPLLYELTCLNGATMEIGGRNYGISRTHRGARLGQGSGFRYQTDATHDLKRRAFWSEARDLLRGVFKQEVFDVIIAKAQDAKTHALTDPTHAVQVLRTSYDLSERTGDDIYNALVSQNQLSQWGLCRAVTFVAQQQPSYDAATDLEAIGGKVLNLDPRAWQSYAVASR